MQPIDKVKWIKRDKLLANDYNPNLVSRPELKLLKLSILETGWTQPIIISKKSEIIDGFHRWIVSGDLEVAKMTGGKVPVVEVAVTRVEQIKTTIRHNRARGSHLVLKMADIIHELIDKGKMDWKEVQKALGMEWEEVDRLYDEQGMRSRGSKEEFNKGWVPKKGI